MCACLDTSVLASLEHDKHTISESVGKALHTFASHNIIDLFHGVLDESL